MLQGSLKPRGHKCPPYIPKSSLHIELVDWEDGHGWETPAMYETRQQNERRAEAVSLMQADSAVQKLQQLFGARWMESSIRLLSDSASYSELKSQ